MSRTRPPHRRAQAAFAALFGLLPSLAMAQGNDASFECECEGAYDASRLASILEAELASLDLHPEAHERLRLRGDWQRALDVIWLADGRELVRASIELTSLDVDARERAVAMVGAQLYERLRQGAPTAPGAEGTPEAAAPLDPVSETNPTLPEGAPNGAQNLATPPRRGEPNRAAAENRVALRSESANQSTGNESAAGNNSANDSSADEPAEVPGPARTGVQTEASPTAWALLGAYRFRTAPNSSPAHGPVILLRRSWQKRARVFSLFGGISSGHARTNTAFGDIAGLRIDAEAGVGLGAAVGPMTFEGRIALSGGWMEIEGQPGEAFASMGAVGEARRAASLEGRAEVAARLRFKRFHAFASFGIGAGVLGADGYQPDEGRLRWNGLALLASLGIGVGLGPDA